MSSPNDGSSPADNGSKGRLSFSVDADRDQFAPGGDPQESLAEIFTNMRQATPYVIHTVFIAATYGAIAGAVLAGPVLEPVTLAKTSGHADGDIQTSVENTFTSVTAITPQTAHNTLMGAVHGAEITTGFGLAACLIAARVLSRPIKDVTRFVVNANQWTRQWMGNALGTVAVTAAYGGAMGLMSTHGINLDAGFSSSDFQHAVNGLYAGLDGGFGLSMIGGGADLFMDKRSLPYTSAIRGSVMRGGAISVAMPVAGAAIGALVGLIGGNVPSGFEAGFKCGMAGFAALPLWSAWGFTRIKPSRGLDLN